MKIKVKVTRQDISDGIDDIGFRCGCPIWQALSRQLGMEEPSIEFANWEEVKIGRKGKLRLELPPVAIEWQHKAHEDPHSAKPFSFEADLVTHR